MWCWAKRSKLGCRASLPGLLLAVAGAFVVPAGAAEPPEAAPRIWCDLGGIDRSPEDSDEDYRISNLHGMLLDVWLDGGNLRLEEMRIGKDEVRSGDSRTANTTVSVRVESLSNGAEQVPILLKERGGGGSLGRSVERFVLTIPLSEEKIRERFESWKQKLFEMSGPEDKTRIEKAFGNPKFFKQFRRDVEHRTGVYRISCEYSSSESGFWNGEVRSEIIVEIYFEKTSVEKFLELHE